MMTKPLKFSLELCPPLEQNNIGTYYEKFKFLLKFTNLVSIPSHPSKNGIVSGFERSFNLAEYLIAQENETKLDILFHITCRDLDRSNIDSRLKKLLELGIERVLVVSGENYTVPIGDDSKKYYANSTELVSHIVEHGLNCKFKSIAIGGYPPDSNRPMNHDEAAHKSLVEKVLLGSDTIYTQCIFNPDDLRLFREQIIERIGLEVEIVPSVAIFNNLPSLRKCSRLMRVQAGDDLLRELDRLGQDNVRSYCKSFIVNLCKTLRDGFEDRVTINICAFGLFDLVADVMEATLADCST